MENKFEKQDADRDSRERVSMQRTQAQERISERRTSAQERIAGKRLEFQKDEAARKKANDDEKFELSRDRVQGGIISQEVVAERELKLEELRQKFHARKSQIDYEFDAKYRDLDFQQYRLQTAEDIRHEKAIILANSEANIAEYKAQLSGEIDTMQLAGKIERDRIREELVATLTEIKAKLLAEKNIKKQTQDHEMAILNAKHEHDMEMEILRDELKKSAQLEGFEDIAETMSIIERHQKAR